MQIWIKRVDGRTEIGPNAVPVMTPETYEGYIGELTQAVSKIREIFSGNVMKLFTNRSFLKLISKEFLSSDSKLALLQFFKHLKAYSYSVNLSDSKQRQISHGLTTRFPYTM